VRGAPGTGQKNEGHQEWKNGAKDWVGPIHELPYQK
jgi:hypothetical protein